MKQYEHGGNVYDYDGEIIDFSSNINPLGIPQCVLKILNNVDLTIYPDIKYRKLKRAVSQYAECQDQNVIIGNGATELINLFVKAFKIKRPLIPSPSFSEYERAVKLSAGEPIYYKLEEERGFKLNIAKLLTELEASDSLIIGNPNNPTGQAITKDEIEFILKKAGMLQIPVMIDEAFIEFMKDYKIYEAVPLVEIYDNLFIVRAATKFFGMPGLRLGYGIGNCRIIEKLEEYKEPWTVNAFADAVGIEIFSDKHYIENTREYVNREIDFMLGALIKIDYLTVFNTRANFILLKLKIGDVGELKQKLLMKGILIRDASNFRYLDKRFFRVAVKRHEDNVKLINALEDIKWDL